MLFRSAICRLAADLPKTSATHDLPQLARFVQRTLRTHNGLSLPVARALSRVYKSSLVESRRSYATSRKTKTTGTVKKKAAAAKKPKKKTPKKTAKKAAPKKKTGPKRVKKEFTPEQKEKAAIRELKKRALKEPVRKVPFNPWLAFWTDAVKGCKSVSEVHQAAKSAGAKWHNLSPTEREHYNVRAKEVTDARRRDYEAWVRSHTPEEIRVANIARAILTNKLNASSKKNRYPYPKIEDERQVKRAAIPHIRYYQERAAAGDYKGILAQEAVKLASSDYKALSASDKKKYEDAYKLDVERYQREYKQTYGHEPASSA